MKVSEQWLREWVNPAISVEALGHQLTMAGLELDGIEPAAATFTNVVIGQIVSVEQHPDADRLRVCQVNVAAEENLQIVTNVASVVPEMKVPVAMIGAELPGETPAKPFKIKKSKLRGVLSQGMFCGADTLGVGGGDDEGLLNLPTDAPLGVDIREYMQLDDQLLEVDLTPNRADCLSIAGIARETGVLTQTPVNTLSIAPAVVDSTSILPVDVKQTADCPHYLGRVIENVNANAPTPFWMQEKLRRSGLRSLSAIVDITNYVLIELGQPMHAFDLNTLSQAIYVRYAKQDEALRLLDGQDIKLNADTLVIADEEKAVALAGIMGGEATAVTNSTSSIFLECAFFAPEKIAGKARQYGLHTDSSHRFERGVSPDLQAQAIERATQLIVDICGGQVGPISTSHDAENVPTKSAIFLRRHRIQRLLGIAIPDERVEDILTRLGCVIVSGDDGWEVTPPLFRFDISIEADLIEELARIYGYDKIPSVVRQIAPRITLKKEGQATLKEFSKLLINRGYQESVTFSFVNPEIESLLLPANQHIALANPISSDLSIMRGTLWSGLIPAVSANLKRQQSRVRLFESGLTFVKKENGIEQRKQLSGVITGTIAPEQWGQAARNVDFYDLKGDVEAILSAASAQEYTFVPVDHPALHPGQSAQIISDKQVIGWLGALHPRIESTLGLSQTLFLFELDLERISRKRVPVYRSVSRYPSIRRDLALLVNENVSALALQRVIKKAEIEPLIDFTIFDVYTGDGVEKGQKSIALSLILQDFSRTLEENDINGYIDQIMSLLSSETGAVLR